MSTATSNPTPTHTHAPTLALAPTRVSFPRIVRSEWIKLRSVRSTWWALAAASGTLIGLSVIAAYVIANNGPNPQFPLSPSTVLGGSLFAQLLVGTLGVLFVASEYSTGMIRSTMVAVPRRVPVVLAKITVFSAITFVTMLLSSVIAFFLGNAVLAGNGVESFSITDDTSVRVIIAAALYLTLLGVLGSALGWLLRSTATALATLLGLLLVVPVVIQSFGDIGDTLAKYLPSNAGSAFASSYPGDDMLSVWSGLAVLVAWVLVAVGAGIVQLRRRDV